MISNFNYRKLLNSVVMMVLAYPEVEEQKYVKFFSDSGPYEIVDDNFELIVFH